MKTRENNRKTHPGLKAMAVLRSRRTSDEVATEKAIAEAQKQQAAARQQAALERINQLQKASHERELAQSKMGRSPQTTTTALRPPTSPPDAHVASGLKVRSRHPSNGVSSLTIPTRIGPGNCRKRCEGGEISDRFSGLSR